MTSLRHVALLVAVCALALSACKKDGGAKVDTTGLTKATCKKGGVKIEIMIPKGYRDAGADYCSWVSGADPDGEDEEEADEGDEGGLITVTAVTSKTIDSSAAALAHTSEELSGSMRPMASKIEKLANGDFLIPLAQAKDGTEPTAFQYYAKGSKGHVVAFCEPKELERTCRTVKNLE